MDEVSAEIQMNETVSVKCHKCGLASQVFADYRTLPGMFICPRCAEVRPIFEQAITQPLGRIGPTKPRRQRNR
jgi:hypothetical protein